MGGDFEIVFTRIAGDRACQFNIINRQLRCPVGVFRIPGALHPDFDAVNLALAGKVRQPDRHLLPLVCRQQAGAFRPASAAIHPDFQFIILRLCANHIAQRNVHRQPGATAGIQRCRKGRFNTFQRPLPGFAGHVNEQFIRAAIRQCRGVAGPRPLRTDLPSRGERLCVSGDGNRHDARKREVAFKQVFGERLIIFIGVDIRFHHPHVPVRMAVLHRSYVAAVFLVKAVTELIPLHGCDKLRLLFKDLAPLQLKEFALISAAPPAAIQIGQRRHIRDQVVAHISGRIVNGNAAVNADPDGRIGKHMLQRSVDGVPAVGQFSPGGSRSGHHVVRPVSVELSDPLAADREIVLQD